MPPTSPEIIDEYRDWLIFRDCSPNTVAGYISTVHEFFELTKAEPLKITRQDLYLWDGHVAARNLTDNTRARARAAMRGFLKWIAANYRTEDLSTELKTIRQQVPDPVVLHPDELTEILHAQDETKPLEARDAAMLILLAGTGIRLSECASLNMGSVARRTVGVGDKKRSVWILRVASAKRGRISTRSIIFGDPTNPTDVVTRHFGLWYLTRLQSAGTYNAAADLPLFSDGADPRKRLTKRSIYVRVKRCMVRAGRPDLAKHIHPHSLRHYYATWRKAQGGDIHVLQKDLGHASIMTTERYVHLAEKATGEQAIRFNPLKDVIAKPLRADVPQDQFRQIVSLLIPESTE